MVIEHDIKDLQSFENAVKCARYLISPNSSLMPKGCQFNGVITKLQAEKAYLINHKKDNRIRRLLKVPEIFCTMDTHISTDMLFKLILQIMNILNKSQLNLNDFSMIIKNAESFYYKYFFAFNSSEDENEI